MKTVLLLVGAILITAWPSSARGQGGTDIYLAPLESVEGNLVIGAPVNVTNRPGYDNQPCFTPDGQSFYFTSIRKGQADIFRYDLERERSVQITRTKDSEYSPTVMIGSTGFSVVQVEPDSVQRLWEFSPDGKGSNLLIHDIEPIGYHAWANRNKVALFVLGEPHVLQLADVRSGLGVVVAEDIGRSLHKVPGRSSISFTHRVDDDVWWIKELNVATRRIRPLVQAVAGSEDYAWTPDGTILMAEGSTILQWSGAGGGWETVKDLGHAMGTITRMAVSPDGNWLAMVADEVEESSPDNDDKGNDEESEP